MRKIGVTGTTQKGKKVVKGEEEKEKNQQDPERTIMREPNGSEGSATPKGYGQVREVLHRNPSQNGVQEDSLGGGKPGIRAIRNVRKGGVAMAKTFRAMLRLQVDLWALKLAMER